MDIKDPPMETLGQVLRRIGVKPEEAMSPPPATRERTSGRALAFSRFTNDLPAQSVRCSACSDVGFVDAGESVDAHHYIRATRVEPCPECQRHNSERADRLRAQAGLPTPETGARWMFDTYVDVNPRAAKTRERVRAWVAGGVPWLLLHSRGKGTGKTHLACAAADALMEAGHAVVYASVPQLMTDFGAAIGADRERREAGIHDIYESRYQALRQRLLGATVLVLDELGRHRPTEFAEETLYEIISSRYASRTRLIVTTNAGRTELDERIGSRLRDVAICLSLEMEWGDYRITTR